MILNWKFQNASDFALKVLQRARFGIEKKTFSKSYWTRHVFILKKTQYVSFSVKSFTTIERRIDNW